MPTSKRADLSKVLPAVRCTARKRNGEPCKAMAARGANVCRVHGGSAPQVKAAAKRRLDQAADVLVQRLLGFALDGHAPDAVALAAIRDALDRAGLGAKQALEIGVEPARWEVMFTDIARISRAEHMALHHTEKIAPTPALVAPAHDPAEIVDAELVPEPPVSPPDVGARQPTPADRGDVPTDGPATATGHVSHRSGRELATLEDATTDAAQANRQAARVARTNRMDK